MLLCSALYRQKYSGCIALSKTDSYERQRMSGNRSETTIVSLTSLAKVSYRVLLCRVRVYFRSYYLVSTCNTKRTRGASCLSNNYSLHLCGIGIRIVTCHRRAFSRTMRRY